MVGTELDEHGNVRVGMQAFKKVELCTMVCAPAANNVRSMLKVARTVASRFEEIGSRATSNFTLNLGPQKLHLS